MKIINNIFKYILFNKNQFTVFNYNKNFVK